MVSLVFLKVQIPELKIIKQTYTFLKIQQYKVALTVNLTQPTTTYQGNLSRGITQIRLGFMP